MGRRINIKLYQLVEVISTKQILTIIKKGVPIFSGFVQHIPMDDLDIRNKKVTFIITTWDGTLKIEI